MVEWKDLAVRQDSTIRNAIEVIDSGGLQIALVVDRENNLIGTVSDGDIRRGLLGGYTIESEICSVVNADPLTLPVEGDRRSIIKVMEQRQISVVPLVDAGNRLVGIETLGNIKKPSKVNNWVVLMAGGLGTRLMPLTQDCPKPMLPIEGRPILEIIIERFINAGFHNFFISVNYLADKIKQYFGDGSDLNVTIRYLEENDRLGTAGPLKLLPPSVEEPIVVMNGDIITDADFLSMLDFHSSNQVDLTIGVRQLVQEIPYGVVNLVGNRVTNIKEKPRHVHHINAGIYVASPVALDHIQAGVPYDMPTLIESLVGTGRCVAGFPLHEPWCDIGHPDDLARARLGLKRGDNE